VRGKRGKLKKTTSARDSIMFSGGRVGEYDVESSAKEGADAVEHPQ